MHRILVIRLYFPLDALLVSDCISPSSGTTFYKLYIAFGICRYHMCGCCVAIGSNIPSYSHTTATHMVPAYTKCDVQLIKFLLMMD